MALRDEWKQTGKELGGAFAGLGKNIVRSVRTGADKVDDAINRDDEKKEKDGKKENAENGENGEKAENEASGTAGKDGKDGKSAKAEDPGENDPNVFNDGSWRRTGRDLGYAFRDLGKSIVSSAKTGLDKIGGSDDPNLTDEQKKNAVQTDAEETE